MDFERVADIVDGVPHMRKPQGKRIYDHVVETGARNVLELGTSHGVSSCYLGAAVAAIGGGRVLTVDRESGKKLKPNILDLRTQCGLEDVIETVFAERTFFWELKRMLEQDPRPVFDFVFLDAAHTWEGTGFAFFLCDKLLNEGGWVLFDDLTWSIAKSSSLAASPSMQALPEEERESEQVGAVFELLVESDPRYEAHREDRWGWAKKISA